MTNSEFVPLTDEIAMRYWGKLPEVTVKAVAAVRDGEVLGISGVARRGLGWFVFADRKDEFMQNKRDVVRAVREVRKLIAGLKLPVYSVPDENVDGAEILIRHVGGVELWQP